jgi:K+-transporting ATPase ATPase C chain
MRAFIRPALMALVILTVLTGLAYPLLLTGLAQVVFPQQANGSLLTDRQGQVRGSVLIGQSFDQPHYFWGRLSATGTVPYNSFNADNLTASSGSNYGPLNPALHEMIQARVAALRAADPQATGPIPVDLITASASGLDPHISPAAARFQARRVAQARGLSEQRVLELIQQYTEDRTFGVLGEPRVHVLKLNLALDQQ